MFHGSVCLQVPPFLSTLVEKLCMKAFLSWSVLPKHEDEGKVSQGMICVTVANIATTLQ